MPSHARTVTRTTHRVRNALLVVLLLLVVCAAAAGFSGFKLYKSAMSAKAHLNNVVNAAKVIKDGSTDDMVKALSDVSYIQKEAAAAKQDVSGGLWTLAEKMPVVGGDVKTARTAIGTIDDFAQTTLPQLGQGRHHTDRCQPLQWRWAGSTWSRSSLRRSSLPRSTSPCNHRPGRSRIFPTPNSAW